MVYRISKFSVAFALFILYGCVSYEIDSENRLVPKNPDWAFRDGPREIDGLLSYEEPYVGKYSGGSWALRFWPSGHVKVLFVKKESEIENIAEETGGTIGFYSITGENRIRVEYFSPAAHGSYGVIEGVVFDPEGFQINRIRQRSRPVSELTSPIIFERRSIRLDKFEPDW